jgi:hypothetical protein
LRKAFSWAPASFSHALLRAGHGSGPRRDGVPTAMNIASGGEVEPLLAHVDRD